MIENNTVPVKINDKLSAEINGIVRKVIRLNKRGIRIVLNPSPFDQAVMACDLDKVSLFLVNEIEGAQISGCLAREPEKILDWFGAHYPNAEVVLTLGADGAWYSGNGVRHFQPAIPVTAVNTTAAGDTFTGYFLEGWSTGRGVEETLRRATRAASIAVSRKGAAPSIPLASELAD